MCSNSSHNSSIFRNVSLIPINAIQSIAGGFKELPGQYHPGLKSGLKKSGSSGFFGKSGGLRKNVHFKAWLSIKNS
jgi:hypothetical protein